RCSISNKIMYASRSQAEEEVKETYFERGVSLFVYQCRWCGKWHLTSHDPKQYQRRNEELSKRKRKTGKKGRAGRI
ncbi:MAG: hypothetical protein IIZ04_01760, partial [Aeriscardovia sp.]|nr:hypothetical protein [Aeriscardovia sp.]